MPREMKSEHQVKAAIVILAILAISASDLVIPMEALARRPITAWLWWFVLIAASWGQGAVLIQAFARDGFREMPEARAAVTVGLGMGILSCEALLLGMAGLFTRPALTLLVLAVLLVGLLIQRVRRDHHIPEFEAVSQGARGPLMLVGAALLINLAYLLVPPVFFDAVTYHLELPSRYLLEGRIFHVGENLYSGYPQLVEILYGAGLGLDGVALAGMISLTSFILTLALLWGWGRKRFGDEGSAWGLAILALSPPLMILVGFFHNDWFAAFFTLAAVFLLMEGSRQAGVMLLAGVMAGLAGGCKYTSLAFAFAAPLAAGIMVDVLGKERFRAGPWLLFLASALIAGSPWYIKNLIFTGDPLYPLLSGLAGANPGMKILAVDTHFKGLALSDLWSWLTVPYTAIFRSWELQFHISPGFLPLILVPTLLSLRGSGTGSRFLGLWGLSTFLAWYLSFRVGRFLLPLLCLGCLYLGAGLVRATQAPTAWNRALRSLAVLLLLAGIGSFVGFDARYVNRTGAAMGSEDPG
ncbi:MAG: glycosyltransferase family 39 protein, partial [bacterium]